MSSFACAVCSRSFVRREHLTRHMATHTAGKPFECPLCHRNFARRDVLRRHQISQHSKQPDEQEPLASVDRACLECATARVRCTKRQPCKRCSDRGMHCVFPPNREVPSAPKQTYVESRDNENTFQQQRQDFSLNTLAETPLPWVGPPIALSSSSSEPMEWDSTLPFGGLPTNWMCDWEVPQLGGGGASGLAMTPMLTDTFAPTSTCPHPFNPAAPAATASTGSASASTSAIGIHTLPTNAGAIAVTTSSTDSSTESNKSTRSSTSTIARSYVDGDHARAPFAGLALPIRARSRQMALVSDMDLSRRVSAKLIEAYQPGPDYEDHGSTDAYVSTESYANLQTYIQIIGNTFPTRDQLATLCRRYFAIFHPVYPFLRHRGFLHESTKHPLLLLSVAALGTRFSLPTMRKEFGEILGAALRDKVRHELPQVVISDCHEPREQIQLLTVLRAAIMDCILGMGSDRDASQARLQRYLMFEAYYKVKPCPLANVQQIKQMAQDPAVDEEELLSRWALYQGQVRAVMMTWVFDCMLQYQCDCRRSMELTDAADIPMPCSSQAWESPTKSTISSELNTPTVLQAVETLYMEKRLPPGLTEFGVCILTHAIFRRTTEVFDRASTALSDWSPRSSFAAARRQPPNHTQETAAGQQQQQEQQKQQDSTATSYMSQRPIPPSSRASMWRNSACDCLDVLHWSANTKVARAAGWEHPNVLLLHLSRLLLLTPAVYLRGLPSRLDGIHVTLDDDDDDDDDDETFLTELENKLAQWAIYDQYKARLAVVHAGSVFWHARRYRCGLWTEPFAVYLATLVLWGYSRAIVVSSCQRVSSSSSSSSSSYPKDAAITRSDDGKFGHLTTDAEGEDEDEDEEEEDLLFYADRPCDDEIVQQFVRRGHAMSAQLARIGDIADPASPAKIVREGMVVLGGGDGGKDEDNVWGTEMGFYRGLERVLRMQEKAGNTRAGR